MDEASESRQSREHRLFLDELVQIRLEELEQVVAREQHQRQLAESLREIGVVLSSSLDQTEVLGKIFAQLAVIIRHDGGAIFLREAGSLVLLQGVGSAAKAHEGEQIPLTSQNPTVRAFYNEEPLIINSDTNEPYWLEWPEGDTLYAWIGVPLIVEAEVVGVLTLDRYEPDSYTEADAQTLQIFAEQAALAIRNARLYEALRKSEERFRTVWDISSDALALSNPEGVVLAVNPAYLTLYGLTSDEVINQPINIIFPETERDQALEQYKAIFASPTIVPTFNSVVCQADSSKRIVETIIGFITQDGVRIAMLSNIRDVTEQRRTEEVQARLAAIVENSDDAIIGKTLEGIITSWNAGAEAMYGYTVAEMVGQSINILLPSHRSGEIAGLLDRLCQGQSIHHFETTRLTKARREINVSLTVSPIRDSSGQVIGASTIARDITERKQVELALRESEERFRTVWDTSADALALSDAEGIVLAANPAYLKLYGYTAEEVIGQPFNIIFPEAQRDWAMEQYKVVFASPTMPPTFNSVVHRADGTERIVETTIGFITQDGERMAMLSNIRDVTEQRHLEEQLRQSQKMEAVGLLAGGMAHHYNNMLTAIMGYVGLSLTELPSDHPIAKDLERIQNTTQRAATLTRQLLTFTSKQPTQLEVINLNDLIHNMEHLLRSLLSSAVEIQVNLAPDLASVQIDEAQFEQVLFNLVGNARDAMPPQRGKLLIQTANLTLQEAGEIPAGDYVQVMVRDNGHGIPEAIKDRIFDPFFTTKEVGQGTGLGLSTCYGIIAQHHGYITVESKSGQGTTFHVYLPRHEAKATTTPTDHKPELAQGKETVLLVEDNDDVRDLVRQVLQRQGYTLLEAENGPAVLSLLEEQPPANLDLLLTDVVMPGMGGVALAKELRTRYRQLKVLMISGYNDDILSQQDILDLEIAFLAKPFSPAKLLQTVRDVLDTSPQ